MTKATIKRAEDMAEKFCAEAKLARAKEIINNSLQSYYKEFVFYADCDKNCNTETATPRHNDMGTINNFYAVREAIDVLRMINNYL